MARTPNIDIREDYQRNYIINGNFDFWQRGTSFNVSSAATSQYTADRMFFETTTNGGDWNITRDTDLPSALSHQAQYSLNATCTATESLGSSDITILEYRMEGQDYQPIHSKSVTVSFWIKASAAGTYSVSFKNDAKDRSYVTSITVDAANTWEKKSVSLTLDDTGTWLFTNQIGLRMIICLASGSNFITGSTEQWINGNFFTDSSQVDLSTNGEFLKLAQVQLTEGAEELPFRRAGKTIAEELQLCQRYWAKSSDDFTDVRGMDAFIAHGTSFLPGSLTFPVLMRALPTVDTFGRNEVSGQVEQYATTTRINTTNIFLTSRGVQSILSNSGFTVGSAYRFHWTADAEL